MPPSTEGCGTTAPVPRPTRGNRRSACGDTGSNPVGLPAGKQTRECRLHPSQGADMRSYADRSAGRTRRVDFVGHPSSRIRPANGRDVMKVLSTQRRSSLPLASSGRHMLGRAATAPRPLMKRRGQAPGRGPEDPQRSAHRLQIGRPKSHRVLEAAWNRSRRRSRGGGCCRGAAASLASRCGETRDNACRGPAGGLRRGPRSSGSGQGGVAIGGSQEPSLLRG
jgi:hypothetical protein